jgi:hypothetical protein
LTELSGHARFLSTNSYKENSMIASVETVKAKCLKTVVEMVGEEEVSIEILDKAPSVNEDFMKGFYFAGGVIEAEYSLEEGFLFTRTKTWYKIKGEWVFYAY